MKKIEIVREGKSIIIRSPYDWDLVEAIKSLPHPDRKWDRDKKEWMVSASHLPAVEAAAKEAAERNNWPLIIGSPAEISGQKEELQKSSVGELLELMKSLPPDTFSLVIWKDDHLVFGLNAFVGEEAFARLRDLSEVSRPIFVGNLRSSYTVRIPNTPEVRVWLASYRMGNVRHPKLEKIQDFPDKVAHFQGQDGRLWAGAPTHLVDMSDLNFSGNHWNLIAADGDVFAVVDAKDLTDEWLIRGGGFGGEKLAAILTIIRQFYLSDWLATQVEVLRQQPVAKNRLPSYRDYNYSHALDEWVRLFRNRPTLSPIDVDWEAIASSIAEAKSQAAKEAIATATAQAAELADNILSRHTKTEILEIAAKWGIAVKKSWKKEDLISAICTNHEVCCQIVGIPKP